jgi:hypothetical protein
MKKKLAISIPPVIVSFEGRGKFPVRVDGMDGYKKNIK